MIFNSIDFLLFFAVVASAFFLIPHKIRWILLLGASVFFYGYWKIEYLLLLILPTLIIFGVALKLDSIQSPVRRKWLFFLGLMLALAGLLVFKYTDFVRNTFHLFTSLMRSKQKFNPFNLVLPIGISFYTFKLVSYLADVYNKKLKAEKHLGYFALYVSFFPQILMGPIDRAIDFIKELKKKVSFNIERVTSGFQLIVWGIFKKMVIADRFAIIVDELFRDPANQGLNLILGIYLYSFQIYCDFSGYTDMAIGISRILGFKSMKNFNFPYFSQNITQFWNKWHISLSTWLRDYLFLPFAYATMRRIKSPKLLNLKVEAWGYMVGMFITMLLGGLWHGAKWTFVAWGILHGIYLITSYITKKTRKKITRKMKLNRFPGLHNLIKIFLTFNMVSFAWIFFRAESFQKAFLYISNIQLVPSPRGMAVLLFNLLLLAFFIILEILYKNRTRIVFIIKMPRIMKMATFALFICLIIIFSVDTTNEFIYFQF
jgi:D-alanyl-lipoteichoic acid acyltransferase DltB (MBOAT superfamily)